MWDFPSTTSLATLAAQICENGGVISAVRHGPAGLLNIKLDDDTYLLAGERLVAFADDEEDAAGLTDVVPFAWRRR